MEATRCYNNIEQLLNSPQHKLTQYRDPQELFLENILSRNDIDSDTLLDVLRRFDYDDTNIRNLVQTHFLNSLTSGAFTSLKFLTDLINKLSKYQPLILVGFVDSLIELTIDGFERPDHVAKSKRLIYVKTLAQLAVDNAINNILFTNILELIIELTQQAKPKNRRTTTGYDTPLYGIRLLIEAFDISAELFTQIKN
ncbi:hypothetical protein QTN25_001377 [Entamoeba marina]